MEKKKKPAIRFKGFTDSWEQRKFDKWGDFYYGHSCPKWSVTEDATIPCIRYGELYTKFGAKIDKVYSYTNMPTEKLRFSKGTEVLIPRVGEDPMDYNHCTWLSLKDVAIGEMISVFNTDQDPLFSATMFNATLQKEFAIRVEGGSVTNLYFDKLRNIDISYPLLAEQKKIAAFFENLDHLITLHQRKYDKLQIIKKAMLEKMFPQNGSCFPEIRFKGFTDSWEQRKLGDVVNRVTRKNQDLVSELPLTISAQYGLIDQNEFFDKRVASKDVSGYYLIENGEFAYNKSTSTDAPWGAVKRLDHYENGVLSTLYIVFGIKENNPIDSNFLVSYYNTNLWHKGIREIAAEGARNHGLLNIVPADFFETELMIPQDIEEQKQIGKFFKELEALITLHQRKYDKLQIIKKAMLEKMFPQNGSCFPEIRFKGFTDSWEQRKLGELGEIMTGSTPSTSKSEYYSEDGIPWVTPTDINSQTISDTPRKLSGEGIKVGRVVPANTILCTCIASIGKNTLLTVKGSFNQQINCLTPNEYNDAYFLLTESEIWSNIMKRMAAAGTMQIVNKTEFSELTTMVPKLEEQKKIGQYFHTIGHLITLHQREVEKLQNIKKSMLETMFV